MNREPRTQDSSLNRKQVLLRSVLSAAIITAVALSPSTSSAQPEPAIQPTLPIEPTVHNSLEIYIEGQEPQVILSGENLDLSKDEIQSLTQEYLPDDTLTSGSTSQSTGWASCWRTTDHWYASFPYESVVGYITAECFGNFAWVKLTGSLRVQRNNAFDQQVAVDVDYAHEDFELARAEPRAACDSYDSTNWRSRNDLQIRYHSGQSDDFVRRESHWKEIGCDV